MFHETPTGVSRVPALGTSAGYTWGTEFPPEFLDSHVRVGGRQPTAANTVYRTA